jgi:hypothetical protein
MRMPAVFFAMGLTMITGGCFAPEVCEGDEAPVPSPSVARGDAGFLPYAHAHNDYEHERPLEDAIAAGFHSVEVDVWYRDQQIVVSHDAFSSKGRLDELYLIPLQEKLTANGGFVTPDGLPFTLWIDMKEGSEELVNALSTSLLTLSNTTKYGASVTPGGLNIILTGDANGKQQMVRVGDGERPFTRDSNEFQREPEAAPNDGSGVTAYALDYGRYLSFAGDGEPDAEVTRRLGCLITHAHRDGKPVRFYNVPEVERVWQFLLDGGTDWIGADNLEALSTYLRGRAP